MKPVAKPNLLSQYMGRFREHILDVLVTNGSKGLARNVSELNVERAAARWLPA